ncbi:MAG: isoamylase early set domain-containing protein [Planctomycetes bacterium]|nr:isoamylase early set domain-containing protein [Planctomycetota bacterium]
MAVRRGGNGRNGRSVTFICREAAGAQRVCVVGDFNQWDPEVGRMCKYRDGTYRAKVGLKPGDYQYKFVVDGVWVNDAEAATQAMNPYGTLNSVVHVA